MSAATIERAAGVERPLTPGVKISMRGVLSSEWIKFRSLRSTVITLGVAVALSIGISALFAAVTASQWSTAGPQLKDGFNAATTSLRGVLFAQLAVGVLGVMFMSSEYATGMIRSSLTVVPSRLPVLWSKAIVFTVVVGVVSIVTSFVAFFLGQALLSGASIQTSIGAAGVLRQVVGAGLYVTVAGLIGLAVGGLLRNTAGGISTIVGMLFVVPPLLTLLPSSYSDDITPYLPAAAGQDLWNIAPGTTNGLTAWVGFGVMLLWAVVLLGGAALRLIKTDV